MATRRYTHILFDHDGVLVDTEPLYFEATRIKLAELGVTLALPEYLQMQVAGRTAWHLASEDGHVEGAIAAKRRERNVLYQQMLRERPIEIDGVEHLLSELERDFNMAIVTTARKEDFALIHAERGIVRYMDFVLANGDYPRSKPAPDPYLAALARYGIQPAQALVVEDSERGLRAAVAAGIDCAVVEHPFMAGQDFSAARFRLSALGDLRDVVYE